MFRLRRNSPRKLCFLKSPRRVPRDAKSFVFNKDQEGRCNNPVGCCIVGNSIKGVSDGA